MRGSNPGRRSRTRSGRILSTRCGFLWGFEPAAARLGLSKYDHTKGQVIKGISGIGPADAAQLMDVGILCNWWWKVTTLPQNEVPLRLNERKLGLASEPGRISEYESGKRDPTLMTIPQYARVAGVHLEDIVDDELDLPAKLPGKVRYKGIKRKSRKRKP